MSNATDESALLSFFLGPVQPFIEAARTVRDLWTGSYLLSWLTVAGLQPVLDLVRAGRAALISPHIDRDNPMVAAFVDGRKDDARSAIPCIPNKFAATVPAAETERLLEECERHCRQEWERIAQAVHDQLAPVFGRHDSGWDRSWQEQVKSYFEVRCVALPLGRATDAALTELRFRTDRDPWTRQWDLLGALLEMKRSVRHVPAYRPQPDREGRFPVKCSLLGSFEQMGPADLDASRQFWEAVASPNWEGLGGTRLHSSDRLCAVSLVKRFAWPAYFADKLGLRPEELRFSDTATVAARDWLEAPELQPDAVRMRHPQLRWSGQWLHWQTPDQEKEEKPCPSEVWQQIQDRKRRQGKPPTYYAILMMDGDHMGQMFRGEKGEEAWGRGAERYRAITARLTHFALHAVQDAVERHPGQPREPSSDGELIYAGGDDVLALLPTDQVVACARTLRDQFRAAHHLGEHAQISAGSAVVHVKEDLRFALQTARAAEKAAKRAGRNALALTVCRRSGEHTTFVMDWQVDAGDAGAESYWDMTDLFTHLVRLFRGGASDRWAYKLRGELPTLQGKEVPWGAATAELRRLVQRVEGVADREALGELVERLATGYRAGMAKRGRPDHAILADFVALCQSASFLARGRD
jgi:CRISPR-associated protein Cmr2